jgi:hypothetical protein
MWGVGSGGLGDAYSSVLVLSFIALIGHTWRRSVFGVLFLEEISVSAGIQVAIDALENGRLALICGAGLSMDPPSSILSAQALADRAKEKYDATHGAERPPLAVSIEEQAAFFYAEGHLADYYLRTLIGRHAFSAEPNAGHYAVADLLLTRCADIALSTNVDRLIETAGVRLGGHVENVIERDRAAAAPPDTSVLFKLHGCWDLEPDNTVWCSEQLADAPLNSRIPEAAEWLTNRLLDRDLLVVGYFTHWEHLSGVLAQALQAVHPARLVIIDPANAAWLQEKAPQFYAIGAHAQRFCHVQETGGKFLDDLRKAFSRGYIRKVLYGGRQAYHDLVGAPPEDVWLEPENAENKDLWRVRRDLEGCMPNDPAITRAPANEPLVGLTLLQLRAAGASWKRYVLELGDAAIRVFRGFGQPLHILEAKFARATAPVLPEIIIAVGAVDLPLRPNVARGTKEASITRGTGRRWLTRERAVAELNL